MQGGEGEGRARMRGRCLLLKIVCLYVWWGFCVHDVCTSTEVLVFS